jgi:CRISPR system Cascade subunit CasA
MDKSVPIFAIHTMSTSKVFSHEHEWSGYGVSSAEAARLLIRLQSVDITSLRAFYPNQTSGNRSAVNTPTINNANILVIGQTLKLTLMMNLIRYDPEAEFPSVVTGEDIPFWEISYAGKPVKSIPNGYISYLTYPWRRLNLFGTGSSIDRIAITMGNSFPDNLSFNQWECGIAFREDKPIRINPDRQLWRDSHSFLQSADKDRCPRIIEWLAQLSVEKLVDKLVCLQIFGMCADKAKPLAWSVEYFSVPILYIQDIQLSQVLKIAITIAEEHQQIFGGFRGSPYHALAETLNNNDAGSLGASLGGKAKYWATLDRAFQELLVALPKDRTQDGNGITYGLVELSRWTKAVQKAAEDAFTESIASIRNYEARAKALRALQWKLADLRLTPVEKEERKSKAKSKKKEKASA